MTDIVFTFLIMVFDRKQDQNKNRLLIPYLVWEVIALHFSAISISYGVKYVLERYKEPKIFTASLQMDLHIKPLEVNRRSKLGVPLKVE